MKVRNDQRPSLLKLNSLLQHSQEDFHALSVRRTNSHSYPNDHGLVHCFFLVDGKIHRSLKFCY